jgi:hypothetical protein
MIRPMIKDLQSTKNRNQATTYPIELTGVADFYENVQNMDDPNDWRCFTPWSVNLEK